MKASSNRVFKLLNARKIHTKYLFNSSALVYSGHSVSLVTPSSSLLVVSFSALVLRVFPSLRRYLRETRKRPIRLTYAVARLLLQRSLQSQFGHSYSRVRILYDHVGEIYTTKDKRIGEGLTGSETQEKTVEPVLPPLRLPFERAHSSGDIYLLYIATDACVTSCS